MLNFSISSVRSGAGYQSFVPINGILSTTGDLTFGVTNDGANCTVIPADGWLGNLAIAFDANAGGAGVDFGVYVNGALAFNTHIPAGQKAAINSNPKFYVSAGDLVSYKWDGDQTPNMFAASCTVAPN